MAAPQSRIRLGCAKGPPGRCISLICAIPTATNCAGFVACRAELSAQDPTITPTLPSPIEGEGYRRSRALPLDGGGLGGGDAAPGARALTTQWFCSGERSQT